MVGFHDGVADGAGVAEDVEEAVADGPTDGAAVTVGLGDAESGDALDPPDSLLGFVGVVTTLPADERLSQSGQDSVQTVMPLPRFCLFEVPVTSTTSPTMVWP